eukprot:jgi/Orpsp1_1/1176065/evm.model.c7180000056275.1
MQMKLCLLEINSVKDLIAENNNLILMNDESVYLEGFQAYIVLDWVTDRTRFCKTIVVYTGNPEHKIHACSISLISSNRESYSGIIEDIFKQFKIDKAKPKTLSDNNIIMVTELISFPTSLTTLPLIDGDYESHKLPCSGRGILTLNEPSAAQKEKFYQLYDIHPSVPFNFAILEIVKILQKSLYLLKMLTNPKCDDGLICNETIEAIKNYYKSMNLLNTDIDTSWCNPTIVKEIIKEIIDLIFKLHVLGYQSQKDPFQDSGILRRQIISFKKNNGLKVIGNAYPELDIDTISKINEIYNKSIVSNKHKYKNLSEKNDFSFYYQHINIDRIKYLLTGKKKNNNENTKSMDNLKNIFSNSIMKLDIKKNNSNIIQATPGTPVTPLMEKSEKRFLNVYNPNDYENNDEQSDEYYDETKVSEYENNEEEHIEVLDNNEEHNNKEKINNKVNHLYRSNSMVEIRTRQIVENFENYEINDKSLHLKVKDYRKFIEESMLINKIKEYQKSKHNHSLNNKYLRKTKSYSDLYETRKSLENNEKIIKVGLKSYIAIEKVMNVEKQCSNSINNIKTNIKDYGLIINKCSDIYKKRKEESFKIINEINQINDNQSKLLSSLQDIDMYLSKQAYDISNIDEKLKDMEELIEQFNNR